MIHSLNSHLKNGTPHSRYFNDELGVPNFLLKTEQMFAMQRDVLYNTNMEKDMFTIKENELSYGRGYVYSLQYRLVCGIRRIVQLP